MSAANREAIVTAYLEQYQRVNGETPVVTHSQTRVTITGVSIKLPVPFTLAEMKEATERLARRPDFRSTT